jgi:hypothetical protein
VKFLTWTDDNLLRQVVYEGLREDKPAAEGAATSFACETGRGDRSSGSGKAQPLRYPSERARTDV